MAYVDIPDISMFQIDQKNFIFLTMFGIKDPLRKEIPSAIN
jgi:hypothetical protein